MAENHLSVVQEKYLSTVCYQIDNIRVTKEEKKDFNSICFGLTLLTGIILDYSSWYQTIDQLTSLYGRILHGCERLTSTSSVDLKALLEWLDACNDCLLQDISTDESFKAIHTYNRLRTMSYSPEWGFIRNSILGLLKHYAEKKDDTSFVVIARQVFSFLKKLDIDRDDLKEKAYRDFLDFETKLAEDESYYGTTVDYQQIVAEMRNILRKHLSMFSMEQVVYRHGPGVVADKTCHSWLEKHSQSRNDKRISYMLRRSGLGTMSDYLPLLQDNESTRTSRFIAVPKTWKKLRGISAEPAELQYFQQGILYACDRMFQDDPFWSTRIDLHDQSFSRDRAYNASIHGQNATIDLSAASDSVRLSLVKDLFGGTDLGLWLMATRSTHTYVEYFDKTVKLRKFAPMGSATCFPVECMVFTLAAEVAVRRTRHTDQKYDTVRVFGDDIVIPSFAATELIKILHTLGFSVNTDKSYWKGYFREACGIEAWKGIDITPVRFKHLHTGIVNEYLHQEDIATLTNLANHLNERGLHRARSYVLSIILNGKVRLRGRSEKAAMALYFSLDGANSTVSSNCPTNFHLKSRWNKSLQCVEHRMLTAQLKPLNPSLEAEYADTLDVLKYTDWLIRHQQGVADYDEMWSQGYLIIERTNDLWTRTPVGMRITPTVKWCLK